MEKYETASLALFVLSFVLFVAGLATSNVLLSGISGVIVIFGILLFKLGQYEDKRGSFLDKIENKDKALLPLFKAQIKKKEIITSILSLVIVVVIMAFVAIMLNRYFFKMSDISLEDAIGDGCAKLNMGDTCITDPVKIIVPYDVNGDGKAGGDGDTFSNLMKTQNCTGNCILKRCGCSS
ncbi:MAG: hypothetical protein V1678_00085 [Candidatus Aenigmatarchaeota archaeon]